MDRPTENIEVEIDRGREMLRSNLEELEARVRAVVDWRRAYRHNMATALGFAFGGALLLGLMARGRAVRGGAMGRAFESQPAPGTRGHRHEARQREISLVWRTIESALIGVAATQLQGLLARVIPGFREQLARRDDDGRRHQGSGL